MWSIGPDDDGSARVRATGGYGNYEVLCSRDLFGVGFENVELLFVLDGCASVKCVRAHRIVFSVFIANLPFTLVYMG